MVSFFDASLSQRCAPRVWVQRPSSCSTVWSLASTSPSPFRSGFAFAYDSVSTGASTFENSTPEGWKSTESLSGSMVSVMRIESLPRKRVSPGPSARPNLGMRKRRNRWPDR